MKWLISLALTLTALFTFASPARAQYTTVSGTVVDANSVPYVSGSYNINFVNTTGQQAIFLGSPLTQTTFSGKLGTDGTFSLNLPSNSGTMSILPLGTQWNFNFRASDGGSGFNITVTITGSTQSLSSAIAAASPVLTFNVAEPGGSAVPVGPNNDCIASNGTLKFWGTCSGGGGSSAFNAITTGTNSTATMTVGTGGTLTFSGSGVVNASTLGGATFASPGAIGGTTPAAGSFTTLSATGNATLSGLLTMGTITGSICEDVSGHVIYNVSANCFVTGGGAALSSISAATGANTIASGNNSAQIWNWALTSNGVVAMTFGETTAATGTGTNYILKAVTLAGSTASPLNVTNSLSGSQTLCALCITPTWNTTGVVDAGILENVTNTASGTGSLLIDLQVGGTSEFKVDKAGNATANGAITAGGTTSSLGILCGTVTTPVAGTIGFSVPTSCGSNYGWYTFPLLPTSGGLFHVAAASSNSSAVTVSAVSLTADVSGVLPVANGGSNNANLTYPSGTATLTQTVASGTAALGTSAISSAACASVVTVTATGTATTDNVMADFNGDPTAVTGYIPSASGMLTIIKYPTANNVNFKVCNSTSSSITPGAITLNWRVTR